MGNITIIVLTKNNLFELLETLNSIEKFCEGITIYIVDGSKNIFDIKKYSLIKDYSNQYKYFYKPKIKGIYPSMNFAIEKVKTKYLMFLNSGDLLLKSPQEEISIISKHNLICVFSSAKIFYKDKYLYSAPPLSVKNFSLWFLFGQLPIHQSMIISSSWSKKNLYPTNCEITSDNTIKRKIIYTKSYMYSNNELVSFSLGGLSSSFSIKTLKIYLQSNNLSLTRKILITIRFFIGNLFGVNLIIMRIKIINFLVSLW